MTGERQAHANFGSAGRNRGVPVQVRSLGIRHTARAAVIVEGRGLFRVTKWFAAVASLAVGALLSAVIQGRPDQQWLACLSLLPLFIAIRAHRSVGAMICGAWWGGCLAYFCSLSDPSFALPSFLSVILVVAAPAVYAGLAARLTTKFGFNPLILGLGWVFVEAALASAGFPRGLLAAASSEYPFLAHIANLLGYLFVAFLGAWVNASLLAIFSRIRISISGQPRQLHMPGTRWNTGCPARARESDAIPSHWLPRAPPLALRFDAVTMSVGNQRSARRRIQTMNAKRLLFALFAMALVAMVPIAKPCIRRVFERTSGRPCQISTWSTAPASGVELDMILTNMSCGRIYYCWRKRPGTLRGWDNINGLHRPGWWKDHSPFHLVRRSGATKGLAHFGLAIEPRSPPALPMWRKMYWDNGSGIQLGSAVDWRGLTGRRLRTLVTPGHPHATN